MKSIAYIEEHSWLRIRNPRCADQGCGKLRHSLLLLKRFGRIVLVDTEQQLNKRQRIWASPEISIREYVARPKLRDRITVVSSEVFEKSRLDLNVLFNICVLDVEVPSLRQRIIKAAFRNLCHNGIMVLIVPRNDQTITVRCTKKNRFLDGHFFRHHGIATFYKNFAKTSELVQLVEKTGFFVLADLSTYRQACLICRR